MTHSAACACRAPTDGGDGVYGLSSPAHALYAPGGLARGDVRRWLASVLLLDCAARHAADTGFDASERVAD